jgi:hypothetical protein
LASKYQGRVQASFQSPLRWLAIPAAKPWIIFAILVLGFGYASFSAFDDVNSRLRQTDKDLQQARNQGSSVQQQQAIDQLRQELDRLSHPPRNQNQLYQGNVSVALVQNPQIDTTLGIVAFSAVTSSTELDMTKIFMFREWPLHCSGRIGGMMTFGAIQQITYDSVVCQIQPSP